METIHVDKKKPLWWILLVLFCMAFIYSIGTSLDNVNYVDDAKPNLVENLHGIYT